MARKIDVNDVIDAFQSLLASSLRSFDQTTRRVRRETLQKQESVDTFLRAAVAFETFRSDWHVAAINRDASVFCDAVRKGIQGVAGAMGEYQGAASLVEVRLDKHPSVKTIRQIIDSQGRNVAFPNGWAKRAQRELAPPYVDKVLALTKQDVGIVRAVAEIRNSIAHRSPSAVTRMNDALRAVPSGLRRGTNRVQLAGLGSFLWASPAGFDEARVELYYQHLNRIAEALRV